MGLLSPAKKDLMQKEWLKVISMLVAMETKDSPRRWSSQKKLAHMEILQNFFARKTGYVLPSIFFVVGGSWIGQDFSNNLLIC